MGLNRDRSCLKEGPEKGLKKMWAQIPAHPCESFLILFYTA